MGQAFTRDTNILTTVPNGDGETPLDGNIRIDPIFDNYEIIDVSVLKSATHAGAESKAHTIKMLTDRKRARLDRPLTNDELITWNSIVSKKIDVSREINKEFKSSLWSGLDFRPSKGNNDNYTLNYQTFWAGSGRTKFKPVLLFIDATPIPSPGDGAISYNETTKKFEGTIGGPPLVEHTYGDVPLQLLHQKLKDEINLDGKPGIYTQAFVAKSVIIDSIKRFHMDDYIVLYAVDATADINSKNYVTGKNNIKDKAWGGIALVEGKEMLKLAQSGEMTNFMELKIITKDNLNRLIGDKTLTIVHNLKPDFILGPNEIRVGEFLDKYAPNYNSLSSKGKTVTLIRSNPTAINPHFKEIKSTFDIKIPVKGVISGPQIPYVEFNNAWDAIALTENGWELVIETTNARGAPETGTAVPPGGDKIDKAQLIKDGWVAVEIKNKKVINLNIFNNIEVGQTVVLDIKPLGDSLQSSIHYGMYALNRDLTLTANALFDENKNIRGLLDKKNINRTVMDPIVTEIIGKKINEYIIAEKYDTPPKSPAKNEAKRNTYNFQNEWIHIRYGAPINGAQRWYIIPKAAWPAGKAHIMSSDADTYHKTFKHIIGPNFIDGLPHMMYTTNTNTSTVTLEYLASMTEAISGPHAAYYKEIGFNHFSQIEGNEVGPSRYHRIGEELRNALFSANNVENLLSRGTSHFKMTDATTHEAILSQQRFVKDLFNLHTEGTYPFLWTDNIKWSDIQLNWAVSGVESIGNETFIRNIASVGRKGNIGTIMTPDVVLEAQELDFTRNVEHTSTGTEVFERIEKYGTFEKGGKILVEIPNPGAIMVEVTVGGDTIMSSLEHLTAEELIANKIYFQETPLKGAVIGRDGNLGQFEETKVSRKFYYIAEVNPTDIPRYIRPYLQLDKALSNNSPIQQRAINRANAEFTPGALIYKGAKDSFKTPRPVIGDNGIVYMTPDDFLAVAANLSEGQLRYPGDPEKGQNEAIAELKDKNIKLEKAWHKAGNINEQATLELEMKLNRDKLTYEKTELAKLVNTREVYKSGKKFDEIPRLVIRYDEANGGGLGGGDDMSYYGRRPEDLKEKKYYNMDPKTGKEIKTLPNGQDAPGVLPKDGQAFVSTHDARHRALMFKSMGVKLMPVQLTWAEKSGKYNGKDFTPSQWPKELVQEGHIGPGKTKAGTGNTIKFPVSTSIKFGSRKVIPVFIGTRNQDDWFSKWVIEHRGPSLRDLDIKTRWDKELRHLASIAITLHPTKAGAVASMIKNSNHLLQQYGPHLFDRIYDQILLELNNQRGAHESPLVAKGDKQSIILEVTARSPDDPKYVQFKSTDDIVFLIDEKGNFVGIDQPVGDGVRTQRSFSLQDISIDPMDSQNPKAMWKAVKKNIDLAKAEIKRIQAAPGGKVDESFVQHIDHYEKMWANAKSARAQRLLMTSIVVGGGMLGIGGKRITTRFLTGGVFIGAGIFFHQAYFDRMKRIEDETWTSVDEFQHQIPDFMWGPLYLEKIFFGTDYTMRVADGGLAWTGAAVVNVFSALPTSSKFKLWLNQGITSVNQSWGVEEKAMWFMLNFINPVGGAAEGMFGDHDITAMQKHKIHNIDEWIKYEKEVGIQREIAERLNACESIIDKDDRKKCEIKTMLYIDSDLTMHNIFNKKLISPYDKERSETPIVSDTGVTSTLFKYFYGK